MVELPVIDIGSDAEDISHRLLEAASTYGFLYITDSGPEPDISPEDVDRMFAYSRDFFSSPTHVKAECSIHSSNSGKNRGWLGMHGENLDPAHHKRGDFKEAFNLGEFTNGKANQALPPSLAAHESFIAHFSSRCHTLCTKILQHFARALAIPASEGGATWFAARHDRSHGPSGSILRLLYYPALAPGTTDYDAATDIRAGAHSDYGSITLLFQQPGQPGLEILTSPGSGSGPGQEASNNNNNHNNETWSPVPVNPTHLPHPPILVNIGDLLAYWTDGLLRSTVHRVTVPAGPGPGAEARDRYSIAYFCHPCDDAALVPIPSARVRRFRAENRGDRAGRERRKVVAVVGYGGGAGEEAALADGAVAVLTAKDHLDRRLKATYNL